MKKLFFYLSVFTFSLPIVYGAQDFSFQNYQEASKAKEFIKYSIKSTKAGLLTTTVDGFVKKFSFSGKLFSIKDKIKVDKAEIVFPVMSMDTDNDSRDEKLHLYCLESDKYPEIKFAINSPLILPAIGEKIVLKGNLQMRGKVFPVNLQIEFHSEKESTGEQGKLIQKLYVHGKMQLQFSKLEIPDPSIWIAKVHDDINIEFNFPVELEN